MVEEVYREPNFARPRDPHDAAPAYTAHFALEDCLPLPGAPGRERLPG